MLIYWFLHHMQPYELPHVAIWAHSCSHMNSLPLHKHGDFNHGGLNFLLEKDQNTPIVGIIGLNDLSYWNHHTKMVQRTRGWLEQIGTTRSPRSTFLQPGLLPTRLDCNRQFCLFSCLLVSLLVCEHFSSAHRQDGPMYCRSKWLTWVPQWWM